MKSWVERKCDVDSRGSRRGNKDRMCKHLLKDFFFLSKGGGKEHELKEEVGSRMFF